MTQIPSYPKVHALGHAQIPDLLDGFILVQEKYDGSQLSWGWDEKGRLNVRSKGKPQLPDTDKMFDGAVDYLLGMESDDLFLRMGVWFRGEWFTKPKHNTLAYPRVPRHGLMLYDAELTDRPSTFQAEKGVMETYGELLNLEVAQVHWVGSGRDLTLDMLKEFAEKDSSLGGPQEGVVIKNYGQFKRDGKVQMGKYVREEFKETHKKDWRSRKTDVLEKLTEELNTERRWEKAVEYLRDQGELLGEVADIGPLMRRVKFDVTDEELAYITEVVMKEFLPKLQRMLGRGLPEWWKERLAREAFGEIGYDRTKAESEIASADGKERQDDQTTTPHGDGHDDRAQRERGPRK